MDLLPAPPLFATADPLLVDVLQSLAAGAGTAPVIARDVGEVLRAWTTASLVVVGPDLAEPLAASRPGRRDHVHVAFPGPPPDHAFRDAVSLGAASVLDLSVAAEWLADELADLADPVVPGGVAVGVVGGSGGAGATTLACAVGQVAARVGPALVVDADARGPGVDRVLGLDDLGGVRWHDVHATAGRLSATSLRDAVPRRDAVGVLTWAPGAVTDLEGREVREVVEAGRRGHAAVVVDLPRGAAPWVDEVVHRCDLVVVVVRPSLSGVASAARLVGERRWPRAGLVLRRASRSIPAAEVAGAVGLPVLAEMADHRRLEESVELGLGPLRSGRGPLFRAAADVLSEAVRATLPAGEAAA